MPNDNASGYTDAQLKALMAHPEFSDADWQLLSSDEQDRALQFRMPGMSGRVTGAVDAPAETSGLTKSVIDGVTGVGRGALKGVGNTLKGMGDTLRLIPGVSKLDQWVPPLEYDSTPHGAAEKTGFYGEQAAEYLIPANAARKAAVRGLVHAIPNAASPAAMAKMNKGAAWAGRAIGEGVSAAGVSALHGDTDPLKTGALAAAIPVGSEVLAKTAQALPVIGPLLAALGVVNALPNVGGVMGGMAVANQARGAARRYFTPQRTAAVGNAVRRIAPRVGRAAVGASQDTTQPNRRRVAAPEE